MRIGIIGAPSTGKTTLARDLVTNINMNGRNAEYVAEYASRYIKKMGAPIEIWENIRIFNKQLEWENAVSDKCDFVVTDSPILLPFVYSMYGINPYDIKSCMLYTDLFKMTLKHLYIYDAFVYLKPTFSPIDDGIRLQIDKESQKDIDDKIKSVFDVFQIWKNFKVHVLSEENMDERIEYCIKEVCKL